MRGFTQNRQIGIALPLAVMNRIRRHIGGSARVLARPFQLLGTSLAPANSGAGKSSAVDVAPAEP
jgi:hypothetical protein